MNSIRIATRTSELALIQARMIKHALEQIEPDLQIELVKIKTKGDLVLNQSLAKIGGKGLFVKELEEALLAQEADLAVHSLKDVPYTFPSALVLAAICKREDPRDVFVSKAGVTLQTLRTNAVIGTSSLRRQMQVLNLRKDVQCQLLRGNVPTRLKKLEQGKFDAIILAAAGLQRLNLTHNISEYFSPTDFLPAVGQGALGLQCRTDDQKTQKLLQNLHDPIAGACVLAERSMNELLMGSCSVPIAGYAFVSKNVLTLTGRVGFPDGSKILEACAQGIVSEYSNLGKEVAKKLIAQGAHEIIAQCSTNNSNE